MKKYSFLLLAAMGLLAGCAKEVALDTDTVQSKGKTVISVSMPGDEGLKTHMGDKDAQNKRPVYWSNGDAISCNGIASEALSDVEEGQSSASFTFEGLLTPPYKIAYPASIWTDATHVTLPAQQTYKSGNISDGQLPMAGYGAAINSIQLSHLCAIVKVSIKRASGEGADKDKIQVVYFKGKNDEQVSGTFAVDYAATSSLTPATATTASAKTVFINGKLATSTETALVYHLVVPARTYANGFDIIVRDENNHEMVKSKASSVTLAPGALYDLPEFEFVPTRTHIDVEISNASELVEFAENYVSDYHDLSSSLVVKVTSDISFDATTSAAFNATGGIGKESNGRGDVGFFNGQFKGDNHTISGLEATVPLFAYTGNGSKIENLTLASSCTYTVNTGTEENHGAMVGRNKGSLTNCVSNADVTINNIQDVSSANQSYGVLVGYNHGGTIDGCSASGNITCSQTGQTITANSAYIGGIAGYQDEGSITDCTYTGNITISDGNTYGGITANGRNFAVAGILGRGEKAIITGCTAGIDGTPKNIDVRGILAPALGGIVGWIASSADGSKVENCNNYMSLSFASNGARANTTPCRIGGIAGRLGAPVAGSNNFGAISSVCNSTSLELGGIVADGVNASNCTNNVGGTIVRTNADQTADQANRYIYIGGIMGTLNAAGNIAECTNHAALTCNPTGTSANTTMDLGGIIGGGNDKRVEISGCINDGEIKFDNDNASATALTRKAIGGIMGNASTAGTTVTECSNSGKVWSNNNTEGVCGTLSIGGTIGHIAAASTLTDCTNSGVILCQNLGNNINAYVDLGGIVGLAEAATVITGTSANATLNSGMVKVDGTGSAIVYARNTQGGILGYSRGNNTKITNSKNTAEISCVLSTSAKGRPAYTGGIVGLLSNVSYTNHVASGIGSVSGVEIGSCNNTGKVSSSNYSNNAGNKNSAFAGGIAGLVCGTEASPASIHDCVVGSSSHYVYRGHGGGLVAYANRCTLTDNTSSADLSGVNVNVNGVGGLVGRLFDSSMTGCTFSGKIARALRIGGLVYSLSEQSTGSTITDCNVNGATLTTGTGDSATAVAVLVHTTNQTNTITGCGVKGTIDGAAITLSSNMITDEEGGTTTVSGTYLIP